MKDTRVHGVVSCLLLWTFAAVAFANTIRSDWGGPKGTHIERTWIGPEYYADRLQDWRLRDGRVECVETSEKKPMRVLHLLTAEASSRPGELSLRVRLGPIDADAEPSPQSWAGFLVGAGGGGVDYRLTALVHHRPAEDGGIAAVVDGRGRVAFRDNEHIKARGGSWTVGGALHPDELAELAPASRSTPEHAEAAPREIELRLVARPAGKRYALMLSAINPGTGELISEATLEDVDPRLVDGGVGLISHLGPVGSKLGYWFRDWQVAGSKLDLHPDRAFGPVLCAQYTLSRGVLKLTAQMPPMGENDSQTVRLEIRPTDGAEWKTIATAPIDPDSCTARFKVSDWDASGDTPYRLAYELKSGRGSSRMTHYDGAIRKEPVDSETFVVAAFTGTKHFTGNLRWNHNGVWFPHSEIVAAVKHHNPDLLFFSGDQIYEGDITGAQRRPLEKGLLDYLDKWYRWCWAFGDLARDRPCICIPDDHDVYHGNLWGAGGRPARRQDDGGYVMPPRFVNMVERTQTSHLPDPWDPKPTRYGIGTYYTHLEYAGVSFAILEDRKFKSSPTVAVPDGNCKNGWFHNPDFDPATQADVPGAVLLGEKQLRFLHEWAADWSHGTWMKVVLSQTIFSNVATVPEKAKSGAALPGLKTPKPGEYPEGYKLAADGDSNGWPQTGRNRALREIRRALAFHIAGDQHLASLIHYGVDEWDDAGYAFCVPSIANTWPRRWFPPGPGLNRAKGAPPYTGQFLDGFGNRMTVLAVANPVVTGRKPAALHDRVPGYGIVRFNRKTRDIVVECWPRGEDPARPGAKQYPGWPVTINQIDNGMGRMTNRLPPITVNGLETPVVQLIDESNGEIVYTLRESTPVFSLAARGTGPYTVRIGDPDLDRFMTLPGLSPLAQSDSRTITVDFRTGEINETP